MWVLYITLGVAAALIGASLYRRHKSKPAFTYKGAKCYYHQIQETKDKTESIKKHLVMGVMRKHFTAARMKDFVAEYYDRIQPNRGIEEAVKLGLDTMEARFPKYNWEQVEIRVQRFPIAHAHATQGFVNATSGVTYPDLRRIYVTLLPDEMGGLSGTSSSVVHELSHLLKHDTNNRDTDRYHKDTAFWEKVDAPI